MTSHANSHDFRRTQPSDGQWCVRCTLPFAQWDGDACDAEIGLERRIIDLVESRDVALRQAADARVENAELSAWNAHQAVGWRNAASELAVLRQALEALVDATEPHDKSIAERDAAKQALGRHTGRRKPVNDDELFGWNRITGEGTCDGCSEHQQLRYEWPETDAWLCEECWHVAVTEDRLRSFIAEVAAFKSVSFPGVIDGDYLPLLEALENLCLRAAALVGETPQ